MSETEQIKELLLRRREEIERLIEQGQEAAKPVALDQSAVGRLSRMEAMQSQAMSVEAQRRRKVELAKISSALDRLADGTYGECVECGEAIAQARLRHDPAAPTCIDCAG